MTSYSFQATTAEMQALGGVCHTTWEGPVLLEVMAASQTGTLALFESLVLLLCLEKRAAYSIQRQPGEHSGYWRYWLLVVPAECMVL